MPTDVIRSLVKPFCTLRIDSIQATKQCLQKGMNCFLPPLTILHITIVLPSTLIITT